MKPQFKTTDEYQRIKNEMDVQRVLDRLASFDCFYDGIFTYSLTKPGLYIQIQFVCEDDLLSEMEVSELLDLKRIEYFSLSYFTRVGPELQGTGETISWSLYKKQRI